MACHPWQFPDADHATLKRICCSIHVFRFPLSLSACCAIRRWGCLSLTHVGTEGRLGDPSHLAAAWLAWSFPANGEHDGHATAKVRRTSSAPSEWSSTSRPSNPKSGSRS